MKKQNLYNLLILFKTFYSFTSTKGNCRISILKYNGIAEGCLHLILKIRRLRHCITPVQLTFRRNPIFLVTKIENV